VASRSRIRNSREKKVGHERRSGKSGSRPATYFFDGDFTFAPLSFFLIFIYGESMKPFDSFFQRCGVTPARVLNRSQSAIGPRLGTSSRGILSFLLPSALLLISAGCGGPTLPQVTGKVMVDGNPAEGAVLLFHPIGAGTTGSAVADSNGSFSIVYDMNPGIPPGRYQVAISWPDPSVKTSEKDLMMGNFQSGPDLLKGRYESKDKSGISIEVDATTKELPTIELSTK